MNSALWILLTLVSLMIIGFALVEVSIRVLKNKSDLQRSKRLSRWGWLIVIIAIIGLGLHLLIFTHIKNIPTPWL